MRYLTQLFVIAMAALVAAGPAIGQTDSVSDADARAIRAVIEAQLAAFSVDDGEKAFSFASEGIRETFGTPENFMAMVKGSYPVVYHPASVSFLEPLKLDDDVVQAVQMADDADRLWLAVYRMQRQPDNSWRISGCILKSLEGSRS
jgi:hypothetical protein